MVPHIITCSLLSVTCTHTCTNTLSLIHPKKKKYTKPLVEVWILIEQLGGKSNVLGPAPLHHKDIVGVIHHANLCQLS